ncbi:MAG TPA: RNA polymerase sigma-70 factor [Burkholderiales bacterium]|nr:RNA polymerase sigma-70 factor [Burkholderiales bacterium]
MSAEIDRTPAFEANRRRLWQIAYRMLGSRAEAEDVVQDAYLRWHHAPIEDVRTPQGWLVTTVTRLAIDRLRQLRTEREAYTGPWLPEPLVAESAPPADQAAELASELSIAFLAVLERLAPEERAAFLLHEVFDSDYSDIARILGKSEAASRQVVSRARKRVRADRPRVQVHPDALPRLLDGFVQAIQRHDKDAMLTLLAEDASWTSDGGGKARAALRVVQGAERVAKFAVGVWKGAETAVEFRRINVNGEPGLAVIYQGQLFSVMAFRTDGQRILDVNVVLNPDKLQHIKLSES